MGFPPIEAVVEGCCCGGSADKKNDLFALDMVAKSLACILN